MRPVELPRPDEIVPGSKWELGPNLVMTVFAGKHGAGDLRIEVAGDGAPTHQGVFTLNLALMVAEERYKKQRNGKGGEFFISHLGGVAHWWRSWSRPSEEFADWPLPNSGTTKRVSTVDQ